CAVLGIAMEYLAYRPLRESPRLVALITAIGMSLLLQTLAAVIFGARPRVIPEAAIPGFFTASVQIGEARVFGKEAAIWIAALVAMVSLDRLVHHTRLGQAMRACALDPPTAALMGINVDRVIATTFAIGSGLAAIAGVLYAIKVGGKIEPTMGYYPGLIA